MPTAEVCMQLWAGVARHKLNRGCTGRACQVGVGTVHVDGVLAVAGIGQLKVGLGKRKGFCTRVAVKIVCQSAWQVKIGGLY